MKKYLGIILDSCALIIASCTFIAMIGSAVNLSMSILGITFEGPVTCYGLVTNGGGLYIAALTHLCVGIALIITYLILDILKINFKFKRLLTILPILVLLVAAIDYFLAIQCLGMLGTDEIKEIVSEFGFSDLINVNTTLGIGAISSGILCLLSSITFGVKTLLIKE